MSGSEPPVWTVRLSRRAFADIQAGWEHTRNSTDEETADLWQEGLDTFLASLATLPERYAVAEGESAALGFSARRAIYRRTRGGLAYLSVFPPVAKFRRCATVRIFHLRHGAQEPLGKDEADTVVGFLDD